MIPAAWRLQVSNESGQAVDVEVKVQGWKVDSNGALSYGTLSADLGTTALASGSLHSTSEQDNTSDLFLGLDVKVTLSNWGGTPAGNVIVYFQQRGEASAEFPNDEEGYVVAAQEFTATGTQHMSGQV